MRVSHSMEARGSLSELFAWWSDYTDGVIDDTKFTKVTRKVLTREGNRIVFEDTFTKPIRFVDRTVVTIMPPDTIVFSSDSNVWKAEGRYSFSESQGRVTAAVAVDLMPQGIWKLVFALPFVKGRILREFREDLKGHLEEFERETQGSGGAAAGAD